MHDKSVVAYLVDIFERAWDRALPFTVEELAVARTVAAETRAMTLRMLVEGHSDAASAKRLGVSARTYASYIAALKEEYGVQTRFQLGWAMSQTQGGRLDPETDAPVPGPARVLSRARCPSDCRARNEGQHARCCPSERLRHTLAGGPPADGVGGTRRSVSLT